VSKKKIKQVEKKQKEEINTILSLKHSCLYIIVNNTSFNGVVFNCLLVKVKSTDGVMLCICFIFFSLKEKIDSDNYTLPTRKEEPMDPIAIDA
jgi:Gpi18-like mannosyltransferase